MTRLLKHDEHGFLLLINYFRLYYKDYCFLLFSCFGLFLIKLILHCFPEYIVTEFEILAYIDFLIMIKKL